MTDYTLYYKNYKKVNEDGTDIEIPTSKEWDIFISAYRKGPRVESIFERVNADNKYWLIHPEYNFDSDELPAEEGNIKVFTHSSTNGINEAEYIRDFFDNYSLELAGLKLCIDITGFMRPVLMFLLLYLKKYQNILKFDLIYTEPSQYKKKEHTVFSDDDTYDVRLISGFEGQHLSDSDNDVLIMSAGYEDKLIRHTTRNKERADIVKIIGFPSLMADMYTENILSLARASESILDEHHEEPNVYFAPANDPFVTAQVLKEITLEIHNDRGEVNLYFSPLGTKAQAVGIALFFINECEDKPISIIYPFCNSYAKEDSLGISGVWHYEVEF